VEDLSAGFLAAPLWAQIGLGLFAVMAVVMFVAPRLALRRHAATFTALAAAAGAGTTRRDAFTEWFSTEVEGRTFEVRRELRSRGRGSSSYRGPTGHLLITATPLSGSRWELHQIEVEPGRLPGIFGTSPLATGDAAFDGRFMVRQDGVPVREGWLDPPTRAALTAFFDVPMANGPVWVQEQRLQHIMSPWIGIDHESLRRLLRQQVVLAEALERTAGWRGPTA
jgi:hypothetical protein